VPLQQRLPASFQDLLLVGVQRRGSSPQATLQPEEFGARQIAVIFQEVSENETRCVVFGTVLGGAEEGLDRGWCEETCAVAGKLEQRLLGGWSGFAHRSSDGERKSKASPRARGPAFTS
jgi:hypothetical protein